MVAGQEAGDDVLGALEVLALHARGARAVALAQRLEQATVLLVGAGEDLGRVGDQRDQVRHLALDVGHRAEEPRRAGGLGDADVEADVGAAVLAKVLDLGRHLRHQRLEPVQLPGLGPLGGEDRGPVSIATR